MKRFNQIMIALGIVMVASSLGAFYASNYHPGPSIVAAEFPDASHWCSPEEVKGIDAYWQGRQQSDNPYSPRYDIVAHMEWYRGWIDAKEHGIR